MTATLLGALSAVGVLSCALLIHHARRLTRNGSVKKRLASRSAGENVKKILIFHAENVIWRLRFGQRRYERELPRVIDSLIMSVRSGSGLPVAFGEAAASFEGLLSADLAEVSRRIDRGYGFAESLDVWTQRNSSRLVKTTVVCLKLAHESGASVANTLMVVRKTVGFALDRVELANTAAAQARASVYVLAGLPFFVSGPMLMFNSTARHFMFHSLIGIAIGVVGLMLDAAGVWWMNKLVQRAQA